jgi:uncharacterized protein YukE
MAEFLKVDPAAVAAGSTHLETAVGDLTVDFIAHEDALADAAPGWIGSSAQALAEVMARWEAKHAQHKRHIGGLAVHMATTGTSYTTTEEQSAQTLRSIDPR